LGDGNQWVLGREGMDLPKGTILRSKSAAGGFLVSEVFWLLAILSFSIIAVVQRVFADIGTGPNAVSFGARGSSPSR
jgi:hypothetical protein